MYDILYIKTNIKNYDIAYDIIKNHDIIYDISILHMISCMISYIKNYDIAYDIIYDGNFSLSCANDIIPKTVTLSMIS
jgi:hypothetical protein